MKDLLLVEEVGQKGRVILGEYDNEKELIRDLCDYMIHEKRTVKVFRHYETVFEKNRQYIS